MIRAASETAPDFYTNRYWHNGIKTPDRRMDGAVSLSGLMMSLIFPFRSTAPYEAMLSGLLKKPTLEREVGGGALS
jgi:hypothetical protein